MKVSQKFVSLALEHKVSYGRDNKKKFITVHDTGNVKKGANAEMHSRLQSNGNSRKASWHWQVDDTEAIQSFPHATQCWAAGDGRADGNLNSIHVEICINSDGDYSKAVANGAKLVRMIMDQENIPLENVRQHYDWSKKDCPKQLRAGKDGISWTTFLAMVAVNKEDTRKVEVVVDTDSLYRVQVGAFSDKKNAERLAKELQDKGYPVFLPYSSELTVTVSSPTPIKVVIPKKTVDELAIEVLAKVHGDGDARRKSLGKRYAEVQARVEQMLTETKIKAAPKRSIEEMAREILNNPKAPTGHDNRRKWLGIDQPTYAKVRARVNQLA